MQFSVGLGGAPALPNAGAAGVCLGELEKVNNPLKTLTDLCNFLLGWVERPALPNAGAAGVCLGELEKVNNRLKP